MTYIRTANGLVRAREEGEADLLKPIDYSDPQVIKNMTEFRERARKANESLIAKVGRERYLKAMESNPEWERMDAKIQPSFHTYLEEMWDEEFYRDQNGSLCPKARPIPKEPSHHRTKPLRKDTRRKENKKWKI